MGAHPIGDSPGASSEPPGGEPLRATRGACMVGSLGGGGVQGVQEGAWSEMP